MSISFINGNPCRNYPVWRFEDGEFFLVKMLIEEKVLPKEVWE
jgi:hypothetical protein